MTDPHEPVEGSAEVPLSDDDLDRLLPALALELAAPDETIDIQPQRPVPPQRSRVRKPPPLSQSLFGLIRPNGAMILLGLVCALAVIESIAAFLSYRERLGDEDWVAIEAHLAGREHEPLILASEWLGPHARMALPQARAWDSIAYPDLRFERFWLLAHASQRPWRGALRAELEGLPRPELVSVFQTGELVLHEYQHAVGTRTFSLLDRLAEGSARSPRGRASVEVRTDGGPCPGSAEAGYRCKEGRLAVRTVEIDYRPRRCLTAELDDGTMATIELGKLELGEQLRGHVGFADFNARLRADPSARVEVLVDGEVAGRWVFTDDQGWAGFALRTPPGRHSLALRLGTTVGGTWQRDGHRNNPTDTLCVELRGFEGVPEPDEVETGGGA